jgi:hypothetical protein
MAHTHSQTESEFSQDAWSTKPSVHSWTRSADRKSKQPSLGKRASRGLAHFLIVFCIGIAVTLGWQSYGDAAREMIAKSSPQLGWLAPQAAAVAQTAHNIVAPTEPGIPSPDVQQLRTMSLSLAAMRQSVDQLAAQLAAGQQQMTGDIAKLQAADQEILDKISASPPRPAAAPARKPAPLTALPSPQAPPVR